MIPYILTCYKLKSIPTATVPTIKELLIKIFVSFFTKTAILFRQTHLRACIKI